MLQISTLLAPTVGQYTSVYAMLQFFGIFLAPLSGRLMDRRPKHPPDTPHNPRLGRYTPYECPNLANQKSRMLVVFDRKLEETTLYTIGILLNINEQ